MCVSGDIGWLELWLAWDRFPCVLLAGFILIIWQQVKWTRAGMVLGSSCRRHLGRAGEVDMWFGGHQTLCTQLPPPIGQLNLKLVKVGDSCVRGSDSTMAERLEPKWGHSGGFLDHSYWWNPDRVIRASVCTCQEFHGHSALWVPWQVFCHQVIRSWIVRGSLCLFHIGKTAGAVVSTEQGSTLYHAMVALVRLLGPV